LIKYIKVIHILSGILGHSPIYYIQFGNYEFED